MNEIVIRENNPIENIRQSTDVAGACKEIVSKSAIKIQGRKYVPVEGWMAIATAHGCNLSATDVRQIDGGISAKGIVRRISDGMILGEAEGFVGDDEKTWASRPLYARRAMAQTRAMSRAARSVFAHVVVLMDAGLSTTPAEEMGEHPDEKDVTPKPQDPAPQSKPAPQKPIDIANQFCSKFTSYLATRDEVNLIASTRKIADYKPKLNGDWSVVQVHVHDAISPLLVDPTVNAELAKTLSGVAYTMELDSLYGEFMDLSAQLGGV